MIRDYLLLYIFGVSTCFISGTVAREAIVNGNLVGVGQSLPYQISLFVKGVGQVCGGAIIDTRSILTAAHCVVLGNGRFEHRPLDVLAGANEIKRARSFRVAKIYVPKEYKSPVANSSADIAVLRLEKPFNLTSNVKRLQKLIYKSFKEDYGNESALISGFGRRWPNVPSDFHVRYAIAHIYNDNDCHRFLPHEAHVKRFICATVYQRDRPPPSACYGDDGSPLVTHRKIGYIVVGVLSRVSPKCNEARYPGIYTRVSRYQKFIENAINDKDSDDIETYPKN